jgi:DNA mismatch repair ATPase MutL
LLYLCQYDDCGDQSAPSLENDKREHDGQHNQVGRSSAAEEEDDFSDARQVLRIQGVAGSTSTYFDMNRIDRAASSLSKRWASINGASVKHFAAALNVENVRILNSGRAVKISRSMLANLQVLRQVDRKFILVQADTSQGKLLLCIDQHAADERVRLEELEADMFGPDGSLRNVETHGHEPPLRLRLNFKERETLQHYEELVSSWGFHFEWEPTHLEQTFLHELKHPETHEEVLLHTTPRVEKRVANADDFRDFIQLLSSAEGRYVHELIRPPAITRLLHSRACRSAIMFGHRLSFSQCTDLIEDLKKCQLPFQCAHGRPSVVPLAEIFSGGFSANS